MRRKEGNKEADILKAATEVFARDGFHLAKISQIAEKAGLSVGTVYLYFENKDHLLQRIFESLWEGLLDHSQKLVETPNLNALEKIDGIVDIVFDTFAENPSLGAVFQKEMHHVSNLKHTPFRTYFEQFISIGEKILAEGREQSLFHPETNLHVAVSFIFGGLRFSVHQWTLHPEAESLVVFRSGIKKIIRNGLSV